MEKQKSFKKQLSFKVDNLERQHSSKNSGWEKQKSFKLEKQKSLRMVAMEKQKSFQERRTRDSPRKRGDSLLHLVARAGNSAQVQEILEDCDGGKISAVNQDGETALYVAAENGHAAVVHELLKCSDAQTAALKANNSFDAFHIAARQGHLDVLKELLSFFPELAMTTSSSNATALDTAAIQGHIEVVNLLLETSPSLAKIARTNGKTVLHSAARMGHVDVVKSLLNTDSSIGLRTDKKGQTALHMAVKGKNIEIVVELLKPDPSIINCEDNKGNTPVHIATRKGRLQILKELLSVGGGMDVNALNKGGETALDIAEKSSSSHDEIAALLKRSGGVNAKDHAKPPSQAKQLKKAVSDIKHEVQTQLQQSRQTGMRVRRIRRKLKKLHIGGLNNAINSNTVVAVLIATIAFAALFTPPGDYVEEPTVGFTLGEAQVARLAPFILFFVTDSLSLFISLSVVVVQTSLIVTEQKAKAQMVFVINKLMWLACVFISMAFISLTFVVVGRKHRWLAWATTAIGGVIMITTIGSMCYCIVMHRIGQKNSSRIKRVPTLPSRNLSGINSDSETLNTDFKLYAL